MTEINLFELGLLSVSGSTVLKTADLKIHFMRYKLFLRDIFSFRGGKYLGSFHTVCSVVFKVKSIKTIAKRILIISMLHDNQVCCIVTGRSAGIDLCKKKKKPHTKFHQSIDNKFTSLQLGY